MITEKEILTMFRLQELYKIKYISLKKLTNATWNWIDLHIQVLQRLISWEIEIRHTKKIRKNSKLLDKTNEYFYRKNLWNTN